MKNRFSFFLIVFLTVGLFISNLVWLLFLILAIVIFYFSISKFFELFKNRSLNKISKGIISFLFVLLIAISIKLFLFDIYKIPSSSMEGTLLPRDIILVNKLKYGPKLPNSPFEIPWVNIGFFLNDRTRATFGTPWWDYKRFSGLTTIKNGDIVVFRMFDNNKVLVKRCVGIAGDTLKICNGDVYIDNKFFNRTNLELNNYEFKVEDPEIFYQKLDSLNLNIFFNTKRDDQLRAKLSFKDLKELKKLNIVKDFKKEVDSLTSKSTAYPNSEYNQWNLDNYGPYIIPGKGMKINLTPNNYALYHKLINEYEGVIIKNMGGNIKINNKEVESYTFKKDYYFMMGDNRKGSIDSRIWGLVPEEHIIGKVDCILFSNYLDKFQWNRLFKSLD